MSCSLWMMDWGGRKTLYVSAFWCVTEVIINAFTKLQLISDIYKGKCLVISYLQREFSNTF
jgi:hypothetical protein